LIYLIENKTVDITAEGSEYSFIAFPTANPVTRFKIATTITADYGVQSIHSLKLNIQRDAIMLDNNSDSNGELFIYNIAGMLIQNITFGAYSKSGIQISNFRSGMYIVKAATQTDKLTEKIVKQ
jgi:hypothetical protein